MYEFRNVFQKIIHLLLYLKSVFNVFVKNKEEN